VDDYFRPASYLHLQLTSPRRSADKLKFLAGSEAAMGAFINDSTPERAASALRNAGVGGQTGQTGQTETPSVGGQTVQAGTPSGRGPRSTAAAAAGGTQ
jgi:UDPglucose--hexose-1-phosphate uridylyltransferase